MGDSGTGAWSTPRVIFQGNYGPFIIFITGKAFFPSALACLCCLPARDCRSRRSLSAPGRENASPDLQKSSPGENLHFLVSSGGCGAEDFGPKSPEFASDVSITRGHEESTRAEPGEPHWDKVPAPPGVPGHTGAWGAEHWTAGPSVHGCVLSIPVPPPSCHHPVLQPPQNHAGPSFWDDHEIAVGC